MQAISLRPQQRLIVNKQIVLCVLVALIAVLPSLSLPLSMLMPLFSCPLMKSKKPWLTLILLPLPAVIVFLYGYHPAYAVALLVMQCSLAYASFRSKVSDLVQPSSMIMYMGTMAMTSGLALWAMYYEQWQAGIALPALIAELVEQVVMSHPKRTEWLYQALSAGLLPVPEGYSRVTLLNLTLDPVFLGELRLMIRSRVSQLVESRLPALMVKSSIILGLFINLRIQRMWGAYLLLDKAEPQKVSVALAPSYSRFRMPGRWHFILFLIGFSYFVLAGMGGFMHRLGQVLYATFETMYQLQGGAVVCGLLTRKNPERRVLGGILTAVLFIIAPFALFLISCFENVFSFRSHAEDDKNEREKNEEEEP